MENFNYTISSEDSAHHWGPINVKNKVVLDLGCGRHDTPNLESSSPIYLGINGASKVIAVDQRQSEIDYFNANNPDINKYEFVCKAISSTDDIRYFISKYNPEAIKCDIEEYERYFFDISKEELKNVDEFALEYHTIDIFNQIVKKFDEWGFTIHTRAYFGFVHAPQMGVVFASKYK